MPGPATHFDVSIWRNNMCISCTVPKSPDRKPEPHEHAAHLNDSEWTSPDGKVHAWMRDDPRAVMKSFVKYHRRPGSELDLIDHIVRGVEFR